MAATPTRSVGSSSTTDVDVAAVIVKGGDNAYVYYYNVGPCRHGRRARRLRSTGGQAPEISHVEFCFDPKDAPDPVITVDKTASGTSELRHSWQIDKQVKLAGAADSTYGDNASLNLAGRRERLVSRGR